MRLSVILDWLAENSLADSFGENKMRICAPPLSEHFCLSVDRVGATHCFWVGAGLRA